MTIEREEAVRLAEEILAGKTKSYVTEGRRIAEYVVAEESRRRLRRRKRPRVGLDCDGPLSDFTGGYLDLAAKVAGTRIANEHIDRWEIAKTNAFAELADLEGITVAELKRRCDAGVVSEGFCAGLAVQPGAVEAVRELMSFADVHVITTPWRTSPFWRHEREEWIVRHFGIEHAHVIQTGRKHFACFDVFVDDKPSHVEEWGGEWPEGRAVLFDMPHNERALPGLIKGSSHQNVWRGGWGAVIEAARSFVVEG